MRTGVPGAVRRLPLALAVLAAVAFGVLTILAGRAPAAAPSAAPGCVSDVKTFEGRGGTILPAISGTPDVPVSTGFPVAVSGMGESLYHLALTTGIEDDESGAASVELTPPGGSPITVRANSVDDEGKQVGPTEGANVFNGTVWEDTAPEPAAKTTFTPDVTATPLEPDQAFARLDGIDPNGDWELTITSYRTTSGGTLGKWSLELGTCQSAPATTTDSQSNDAAVTIPASGGASSSISVSNVPCYLESASVTTDLVNNSAPALAMTLTSPQGETVSLTHGNGTVSAAEVFNGTVWEDAASTRVTSAALTGGVTASPLEPEQGLERLTGEDPNGTWTLATTNLVSETAELHGWSLELKSVPGGSCPAPVQSGTNPGGSSTTTTPSVGAPASTPAPPAITALALKPNRFRVAAEHGAHHKLSGGAHLSFTLSAAASVRLAFEALGVGVKSGSHCLAKTRHRHGRTCTLARPAGSLAVAGHTGVNALAFTGKLDGRALAAGSYRLLATIPASPSSKSAQVSFSII